MKKLILPAIYIGEWVLFMYVLLFVTVFNMTFYANMVLIDMPWEEPIKLPFINALLFVFTVGLVCFLYIKYLVGNRLYIKIKSVVWGFLFGLNLLSCLLWFSISGSFALSNQERFLLIVAMLVSAVLTIQIAMKLRSKQR
ncbi:hypothetical protein ACFYKX_13135 [Cytobacillus sp. FJAT-54145]|uniref:Uncharacterized protein n=1 Tax=Cytobacillus spartinae TaxID=3299023 RepID=A0ABW6KD92_9BACI